MLMNVLQCCLESGQTWSGPARAQEDIWGHVPQSFKLGEQLCTEEHNFGNFMFVDSTLDVTWQVKSINPKPKKEDEFHKSNDHLLKELENKLDRLELDSIKDLLEKQMKKFKKIQQVNLTSDIFFIADKIKIKFF